MILVTTALTIEAKPLVARLGLAAEPEAAFPVYRNEEIVLVVTGVGGLKAAAGTGWALGRFPEIRVAINIGFCGASPEAFQLHEWVYISSIRDRSTDRLAMPDILRKHPFREAALLTVPVVVKEPMDWPGVVDMEGSGFFEAAGRFLPPDRIALLKWVSDPLTGSIDIEETIRAYTDSLEPAIAFVQQWPRFPGIEENKSPNDLSAEVERRLRLTRTQRHFVRKWADGYLARGGDPETVRQHLPGKVPATKAGNTKAFEALKNVFKN